MLGGEYKHNLDAKNRIFVPAKLREELGETFIIAKATREPCLKMYSQEGWKEYLAPLLNDAKKLAEKKLADRIVRYLHASMVQVTPDSQGRVVLPPELVGHAKIEKNVTIVGCYDHAELWSEAEYNAMKAEEDVEKLLDQLEALGL